MALKIQINPKQNFTLAEQVLYARDPGRLIFKCLEYIDQDKAKRVSKRCLDTITTLQREDILRDYPPAHLNLVGGSIEALKRLPIRNIPNPAHFPQGHKFPNLAVGWTRIKPENENESTTWKLHVYKQEMSVDKTAKNMVAIYFNKLNTEKELPEEQPPQKKEVAQTPFVGIWGVESACCSREKTCCCTSCTGWVWKPFTCILQLAFFCGCTTTLTVREDFHQKRSMVNLEPMPAGNGYYCSYKGMNYIPIRFAARRVVFNDAVNPKTRRNSDAKLVILVIRDV